MVAALQPTIFPLFSNSLDPMSRLFTSIFGPRVPAQELRRRPLRFVIPTVLMLIAGAVLLVSFSQPYWKMTLYAPQYPKGLHVQAYLNRLEGDVAEIDGLNHYIGMRPLNDAAQLERQMSLIALIVLATLVGATIFIHSKWAAALTLPAIAFPAGFLLDLYFWLDHFGQNLDPKAALSSSIKPFTPPVLGEGVIGQFRTVASPHVGLYMACVASAIVMVGLYFHRRAYKPLMDRALADEPAKVSGGGPRRRQVSRATASAAALAVFALVHDAVGDQPFDLQAAINAAQPGSTIRVPASRISGQIIIDRQLIVEADGAVVIDGGGKGDVVKITAPSVVFRGFTVRGSGTSIEGENAAICATATRAVIENNIVEDALFGVSLKSASESVIRHNIIRGKKLDIARRGDAIRVWQSHDVLIEDNTVSDGRDVVMWFADRVTLRRNHVIRCRYGMHFMYTHDNVIEDNRLENNSVGAFLMYSRNLHVRRNAFTHNRGPSGYGLGLKDMQGVIAEDNVFAGNRVGVYLDNPPIFGGEFDTFTRNIFAFNDLGIAFLPMVKQIAFTDNTFQDNMQQVAVLSGGQFSGNKFAVDGRGNYWSDYRGFDLDGDGIGDLAYRSESLFENLMDREPSMRLFIYSPAQQAIELAARAFPIMQPDPKVTDDSPLMAPVPANITMPQPPSSGLMWLSGATLLGISSLALTAARSQFAFRKQVTADTRR